MGVAHTVLGVQLITKVVGQHSLRVRLWVLRIKLYKVGVWEALKPASFVTMFSEVLIVRFKLSNQQFEYHSNKNSNKHNRLK